MFKSLSGLAVLAMLMSCSSPAPKKEKKPSWTPPATLEEAVKAPYRTPENVLRDQYRHPVETLNFFGLKPEMTVVEIWPSGGWYTEIIAPYLSGKGSYIMADPEATPGKYTQKRFEWMNAHPDQMQGSKTVVFNPPKETAIAADESVDMILTFRNVHNWEGDFARGEAFKAFYKALKPGGVLGVVDHRARVNWARDLKSGYILEKDVIRYAERAGFKLEASSDINNNPKDTKNHPEGVWTLPPSLRLGERDKAKYMAIGESDRFTLKFVKPMK